MSVLNIRGRQKLEGFLSVQGSKNGALPLMAAALLHEGTTILHNIPHILDVHFMIQILEALGCICTFEGGTLAIDASVLQGAQLPREQVGRMRSSIFLIGPLLGRCQEAVTYQPGGCSIGERPIDLHLWGLRQMNVDITEEEGTICLSTGGLTGKEMTLAFPSVGATENILMAAVKANGTTVIKNAAREPEIVQLCLCLNRMGAKIQGIGSKTLRIDGVTALHDSEWTNQGDRIAAATYLAAVAACGGEAVLHGIEASQLYSVLSVLSLSGCEVFCGTSSVCIRSLEPLRRVPYIRTSPFPGFPTDMQSPILALFSVVPGETVIEETIFENRFQVVGELGKMGAQIETDGTRARICGVRMLHGACVRARDLRGGAALVVAGLAAHGTTRIEDCSHIQRGYEDLEKRLVRLGADIRLEEETQTQSANRA